MADDNDPNSSKKHRIIHWNPEAGKEQARRRWTLPKILLWGVCGFFGLLFLAGGVIRVIKLVSPGAFSTTPTVVAKQDPMAEFKSQSEARAESAKATAAVNTLSKLPLKDLPKQFEKFLLMQTDLEKGNQLLAAHEYSQAYAVLKSVNLRVDELSLSIKTKQEAQTAYNALMLKIRDLEIMRNTTPEALDAATSAAGISYRLLSDGDFLLAKKTIDQGMEELKKAEKAVADKVQENIWTGQQALLKGDKAGATVAFKAALEMAQGNEAATQGLKRAETIDRVHALLLQAETAEQAGEYAKASESYKNAFDLDKFSAAAQQGQARAKQLDIDTRYGAAFKAAQAALDSKDWEKVISNAKAALEVIPGKAEVATMLKTAQQSLHDESLQKALKRGKDAEDRYDWVAAKDAYDAARTIEPDQPDATEGILRASGMIRALLVFKARMETAEQLAARNDFQGSIAAFNEATKSKPSYLAIEEKTQQLHALLQQQKDPVEVSFQSDGSTFVTIEGYKNLNLFRTTKEKILPGDYQIIGRRRGYRDVIIPIQVRNGSPLGVINVVCQIRSD